LADRTGIVQRAVEALRLPSAWLSVQENVEDPAARFSLPSDDATALSAAFRDLSADMMVPSLQMPFLVAKRLLAQRFPGKPLTLSADDVVHLIVAMRTVEQMVARISGKEPVLPPPRRGRSPAG
jgi:hypothetical protein